MSIATTPEGRVRSLSSFFTPRSVAVVGASPKQASGGHKIFRNLIRMLDVPVYPIHPTAAEVLGHTCFASIGEVPGEVDLAVIFVPSQQIPGIVDDCIAAGVKAVCVEAGGFADAGEEGAHLQQRLAAQATSSATRIWGPNCAGYVSSDPPISTAFVDAPETISTGNTSLVFQSGMAAAALLAELTSRGFTSIDKACSIGNKVDVDEADLLAYLASEGRSNTVALYLESIVDGERFSQALSSLLPGAIVCALMGNRTPAGHEAASTHTGAVMMQSDSVGSYLRHHGVVEVADFTELVEMSRAFGITGPRAGGPRVAVVTFSGAAGVVAADLLEESGLTMARLSEATIAELRDVFPDWYEPSNPVDVWSTVEQRGFAEATGRTTRAVLADEGVDAVIFVPLAFDHYTSEDIHEFATSAGQSGKPVVVWPIGDVDVVSRWAPQLERESVPVCSSLAVAVKLLRGYEIRSSSLTRRAQVAAMGVSAPDAVHWPEFGVETGRIMNEVESKRLMSAFGIATVQEAVVSDPEDAVAAGRRLGPAVALKLLAPGLAHKTDVGGVVLDVIGDENVASTYQRLIDAANRAGLDGPRVVVQPMVGEGVEMIVGAKRDPSLGWMVVVGMGGVDVESATDVAVRPAPLTRADAQAMIEELRGAAVLMSDRRDRPPADVDALLDAVLALSAMAQTAPPRVDGIEINPVLVQAAGRGAIAVDGLITLIEEEDGVEKEKPEDSPEER